MEKLVVHNNSAKGHSLEFHRPLGDISGFAGHHKRRAIKNTMIRLVLPPSSVIDLVKATGGIPVRDLERSTSFRGLMMQGFVTVIERVSVEGDIVEETIDEIQPENLEGILFPDSFFEVKSIEDALIGLATYKDIEWFLKTPPRVIKGYYSSTNKKAGRPPGSKNKKKPGRPKKPAWQQKKPSGRKPGRPKGSKNKPKKEKSKDK